MSKTTPEEDLNYSWSRVIDGLIRYCELSAVMRGHTTDTTSRRRRSNELAYSPLRHLPLIGKVIFNRC